jgi:hypothetical protein
VDEKNIITQGFKQKENKVVTADPYSLVVNAEMAPGFHILVYAKTDQASAYLFLFFYFFLL